MADDLPEDRTAEILGLEPAKDRSERHAAEGKLQWATVDGLTVVDAALKNLTANVTQLTTSVAQMAAAHERTDRSVERMNGWLLGSTDDAGQHVPGVLQRVASLDDKVEQIKGILDRGVGALVDAAKSAARWVGAVGVVVIAGVLLALVLYLFHIPRAL